MNLILYYLSICSIIYYGLPFIGKFTEDPLMQKLYFLVGMLASHYLFYLISGMLSKINKKSWSELTDKSFLGGFAVLFGLLLYYDLDDTDVIISAFPQITTWYKEKWFSVCVIISPVIFLSLVKILFSAP